MDTAPFIRRLWLTVLALNGLVAGLCWFTLSSGLRTYQEGADVATQNLALALEREIAGVFDVVDLSLQTLAKDFTEKQSAGDAGLKEWSENLRRQGAYMAILSGIRGVDSRGMIVWGLKEGEEGVSVADREYFRTFQEGPRAGLVIAQPVQSRLSHQWSLPLCRRLEDRNGNFAGIVVATLPLKILGDRFAALKLGDEGSIGFRDGDLRLILRHPELKGGGEIGSTRIAHEFTETLGRNPMLGSYTAGTTSIDGTRRRHSYRRNATYDFYINVGVAEDDYMVGWHTQIIWTVSLAVIFLAATIMFGLWLRTNWRLRNRATQRLAQSEADFRLLAENSPYGLVLLSRDGRFEYLNPELTRMLGYTLEDLPDIAAWWQKAYPNPPYREMVAEAWRETLAGPLATGTVERTFQVCGRDGKFREILFQAVGLHDGRIAVTFEDVTERRVAQREIENLAFFDVLTGLPNRRLLLDRLQHCMAGGTRSARYSALLFLDLDHFKQLNDTQGHLIGDLLLVEISRRLQKCLRRGDTVARLGGDEFVVLLEQLSFDQEEAAAHAGAAAGKILDCLSSACDLGVVQYRNSASIGIALFLGQELSVEDVLKRADMAMYQAKESGRNTMRFFDPEMQARIAEHVAMEHDLHTAIEQGHFVLHYQPQVDRAGTCIGVEALLRWQHPQHGTIPPQAFIPLAEDTGLIIPIGQWVLHQACCQLAAWQHCPGMAGLTVAINVSVKQFKQTSFVEDVRAALEASHAAAAGLKIEITESHLAVKVDEVVGIMKSLRQIGVGFALDDFGTGYSSLSYLKALPLDQLKIDRSFVRDIVDDPNDAAICRAVVALGRTLGLSIVAEGVESERQWEMLSRMQCDGAQGYLFAKPMPAEEFSAWFRRRLASKRASTDRLAADDLRSIGRATPAPASVAG